MKTKEYVSKYSLIYKVEATLRDTLFEIVFRRYQKERSGGMFFMPKVVMNMYLDISGSLVIKAHTYCMEGQQREAKEMIRNHINNKLKVSQVSFQKMKSNCNSPQIFYR
jgi:hypothetical protein